MSQITKISVDVLKVHPRNQEFFDDIDGKDYEQFKKSIEEDGVITPLIVAPDMVVVSGHQRLKACRDLGLKQIPVIIREDLEDEDEKLKKLLATNFGRMKNDPNKQRKVAVQYVELCGYKNGGDRKSVGDNRPLNQVEIAKQLGVSHRVLKELLEIERKLTPDIKDLLDTGIITKTSASKIWTKLTEKEQLELLEELGKDKIQEMTQAQMQKYLVEKERLEQQNAQLEEQLYQERIKQPEVIEIDKTDYKTIDKLKAELERQKEMYELTTETLEAYKDQLQSYEQDSKNYKDLKRQIELLTKEKDDMGRSLNSATELSGFVVDIQNLLKEQLAPVRYSRSLIDMRYNSTVIKNITDILECVENWCGEIRKMLPNNNEIIVEVE